MRFNRFRTGSLTAFVMLTAWAAAPAGQMFVPTGRDTLRGLPGLEVAVETLPTDLERLGLTTAAIGKDVAQRLRAAGVTIYGTQKENPSPAKPYVYVHLAALELADRSLAVAVQLHVRQMLQSAVTGSQVVNAVTWDLHTLVAVRPTDAAALTRTIEEMADRLAKDWSAVH